MTLWLCVEPGNLAVAEGIWLLATTQRRYEVLCALEPLRATRKACRWGSYLVACKDARTLRIF